MAISDVNEINRAADNGTFLQAAFEVIVSNSKNNDTQNVTGIAVDGSGNPIQAISGNIYVVDELTLNEGYTEAGIKNTNTTLMKAAESGAVEGRPGDHTGLYVHNTYNVNVLSDGQLKVNFPGKTLGLITLPGERSDYTELIVGEKYKFAISNFSAAASYSVGNIFTVDNGVWKLTEAESVNAGDVYAVLAKISQFTEGGMYAGTGYVLEIKRKAVTDTVGTTVIANPTLAGTEPALTGLQVGDDKYKVPDEVVANPAIPEGVTPTALSNLKIGSNYFSAGSEQHLYWHSIEFEAYTTASDSTRGIVIILSSSAEEFTQSTFCDLLLTNSTAKFIVVGGYIIINTTGTPTYSPYYLQGNPSPNPQNNYIRVYYYPDGYTSTDVRYITPTSISVTDAVNQIF